MQQRTFTVTFENNVKCYKTDPSQTEIRAGGSVKENEEIMFVAQTKDGKIVDFWSINNKPMDYTHLLSEYHYTVLKTDANNGVINVSFTEKEPETLTLQFEEAKIKCIKPSDPLNSLNTGVQVKEGEIYHFSALNLAPNTEIKFWVVNTTKTVAHGTTSFVYTVNAKHAPSNNKILNIKFE